MNNIIVFLGVLLLLCFPENVQMKKHLIDVWRIILYFKCFQWFWGVNSGPWVIVAHNTLYYSPPICRIERKSIFYVMKSELVIKLWERIRYILHDDEYSTVSPQSGKLGNLQSVFKLPTMKKIFIYWWTW